MATTSNYYLTVDGVRLDTLAWNISEIEIEAASSRTRDQVVPGVDGIIASLNDDREAAGYGLSMFVRGTDANGIVTGGRAGEAILNDNLDELLHLFGKRYALIDLQRRVLEDGTMRRAWVKVTDTITPKLSRGAVAEFTVGMVIPAGSWEDISTVDWAQAAPTSGTSYIVAALNGSSETIDDAIILVTGPAVSPKVTDVNTGAFVQLGATLASGDTWRVNVATWATRSRTLAAGALTFASADTLGTDRSDVTTFGGMPNQAPFLPLTPVRGGGTRRVQLSLTATTMTGTSKLEVRARRRYRS